MFMSGEDTPALPPPVGDFCSYSSSFSSGISEIPEFFLLITWDFGGAADFVEVLRPGDPFAFFFAFLGFLISASTLDASISVPVVAPSVSLGKAFGFLTFFLPLGLPPPPA